MRQFTKFNSFHGAEQYQFSLQNQKAVFYNYLCMCKIQMQLISIPISNAGLQYENQQFSSKTTKTVVYFYSPIVGYNLIITLRDLSSYNSEVIQAIPQVYAKTSKMALTCQTLISLPVSIIRIPSKIQRIQSAYAASSIY